MNLLWIRIINLFNGINNCYCWQFSIGSLAFSLECLRSTPSNTFVYSLSNLFVIYLIIIYYILVSQVRIPSFISRTSRIAELQVFAVGTYHTHHRSPWATAVPEQLMGTNRIPSPPKSLLPQPIGSDPIRCDAMPTQDRRSLARSARWVFIRWPSLSSCCSVRCSPTLSSILFSLCRVYLVNILLLLFIV